MYVFFLNIFKERKKMSLYPKNKLIDERDSHIGFDYLRRSVVNRSGDVESWRKR